MAINSQGENMETGMKLPEKIYFEMPLRLPEPLQTEVLGLKSGESRVYAPAEVDLQKHQTLPLLYVAGNSNTHISLVPSFNNTAIVAVELDSGLVTLTNAYPADPQKTYPPESPREKLKFFPKDEGGSSKTRDPHLPPPPPGGPDSITKQWLDLSKLKAVSLKPGHHALRVLQYDAISNPALIRLVDSGVKKMPAPGFPADRALEIEMDARRANAIPKGIRAFEERTQTPKLDVKGVSFVLPSQIKPNEALPFFGAAKLAIGSGMVVDPGHFEGEMKSVMEEDLPFAIVPVSILVAELDRVPPLHIEIKVPCHGVDLQIGSEASLAFSLDLNSALHESLNEGTYFVYLLAGEFLKGPHRIDVIEDM